MDFAPKWEGGINYKQLIYTSIPFRDANVTGPQHFSPTQVTGCLCMGDAIRLGDSSFVLQPHSFFPSCCSLVEKVGLPLGSLQTPNRRTAGAKSDLVPSRSRGKLKTGSGSPFSRRRFFPNPTWRWQSLSTLDPSVPPPPRTKEPPSPAQLEGQRKPLHLPGRPGSAPFCRGKGML